MEQRTNHPEGRRRRRYPLRRGVAVLAAAVLTLSAAINGVSAQRATAVAKAPRASGAIVIAWNKALLHILGTPGAQPATIHPTRSLAILHAAIYNAVVSITHSSPAYLFSLDAPAGARSRT